MHLLDELSMSTPSRPQLLKCVTIFHWFTPVGYIPNLHKQQNCEFMWYVHLCKLLSALNLFLHLNCMCIKAYGAHSKKDVY